MYTPGQKYPDIVTKSVQTGCSVAFTLRVQAGGFAEITGGFIPRRGNNSILDLELLLFDLLQKIYDVGPAGILVVQQAMVFAGILDDKHLPTPSIS